MKKRVILTLVTCLSMSCLMACSSGTASSNTDTPAPTTTTKTETPTTTPEPTTEEPTTEEPTTEYIFKGEQFAVDSSKKDLFMDLVVEKGHKFALNDIVGQDEGSDGLRGGRGRALAIALYGKNHVDKADEFVYTYWEAGADSLEISYDQNVVIEYNEEEKMYFHFVKEERGYAYFDVYEID